MENPFLEAQKPNDGNQIAAAALNANLNFNALLQQQPRQQLVANEVKVVAPVPAGKLGQLSVSRPLLAEEMIVTSAVAGGTATAVGLASELLGPRMVSMGLPRIGNVAVQTIESGAMKIGSQAIRSDLLAVQRMTSYSSTPFLRAALTVGTITAANYALDQALTAADPKGESWYSLGPTEGKPYNSTIFAPTIVESVGYGLAYGLRGIGPRGTAAIVAGSWTVGRLSNVLEHRLSK